MSSFIFEKVSVADDTEESIGEQFVGGLSVAKIMKRNNPDDNFKKFESFILPIGLQYNAVKEGGGNSISDEEYSFMDEPNFLRVFHMVAKDLGNSRSNKKTKKHRPN